MIAVEMEEKTVIAPGAKWIKMGKNRSDILDSGPLGQAFGGYVAGWEGRSRVSAYVSNAWVYGAVHFPGYSGTFEPRVEDETKSQFVGWRAERNRTLLQDAPPRPGPANLSAWPPRGSQAGGPDDGCPGKVVVYKDDLETQCKGYDADDADFSGDFFTGGGGSVNNAVSAIRVATGYTATLYDGTNHVGTSKTFSEGDTSYAAGFQNGGFNDIASSIKVTAAASCTGNVVVYRDDIGTASKSYGADDADFSGDTFTDGSSVNNKVSSITVPSGMTATLYDGANYGTPQKTFSEGDTSYAAGFQNSGFNDIASSLKIACGGGGGGGGTSTLENGGTGGGGGSAALNRGKYFTNVPSGTINEICAWAVSGNSVTVAVKPEHDGSTPLFTEVISTPTPNAWNCKSVSRSWSNANPNLFIYNTQGDTEVGWDAVQPFDSWCLNQCGVDWQPENFRRGYRLTLSTGPNVAPTAFFTWSRSQLTVSVDASGSTDSGGSITSYAWTWGDGASGTGVTASHTYSTPGTYAVTLTVTDNGGLTASTSQSHLVMPTAYVVYDVEDSAVNENPPGAPDDWGDWVASAFNENSYSWRDAGVDPVLQQVYLNDGITIATHQSCDNNDINPTDDYAAWLANGFTIPGVNAYQLVTGLNLNNPEGCHGLAHRSTLNTADATSVIEGLDWNSNFGIADAYDPGNLQHRAHLTLHEFGHQLGSDHYDSCNDATPPGWDCNTMCCNPNGPSVLLFDQMGVWWTSGSKDQIRSNAWPVLH